MFDHLDPSSLTSKEEKILNFWQKHHIFQKSLEKTIKGKKFTFYDGPPFATGHPHYGHLLAGTIKDVVPRYKTMKGFYVERRFGWDCHGLPVENEIEKNLNLSGAPSIEAFGIANFNEACRSIVLRYTSEWQTTVERMGRWVDFKNTYKTMDIHFMESVFWVFKTLFNSGLVYEGYKVMPYSTKLGTPLSNFEANLNYKEVDDPSLTVKFPLKEENAFFLVWTTTPWTLPSNLAIMASKNLEYAKIFCKKRHETYILAKARLSRYFPEERDYELLETFSGSRLEGKTYTPLFDYYKNHKAFYVLLDDGVSESDGTGLVHTAPAFGEMDFYACQKAGIEPVCPVDQNGCFTAAVVDFCGLFVKDADKDIMRNLKAKGLVFEQATLRHRYPYCWRSDTPLIYRTVSTWFVSVEKIKDDLIKANQKINWVPQHIKEGRFGKWLEGARDWAISRNRYWGTPIPIWRAKDGEILVVGSIKELEALTKETIVDLHRHYLDDLEITHNGKVFKRIPEVFDCWFESGSMPYAQEHYPFEHEEKFTQSFPGDFIAEGLDQTRGWFYTLNVLSVALFNEPAFKNVIVNGIILAEDGNKMSKRLKNYPDPMHVVDKYGADALRLYLLSSPAVMAEDLKFSERGVELIVRSALIPLWNSYQFLSSYARLANFHPDDPCIFRTEIDLWLESITQKLVQDVTNAMENYHLNQAVPPLLEYIDQLTNWFIRRSRERFWSDKKTEERQAAFLTLYHSLFTFTKVAAPFMPFLAETIYQGLKNEGDPESVHLCSFPQVDKKARHITLEESMSLAQIVVSLGHKLRKETKLKVRQPLKKATLVSNDPKILQALEQKKDLIQDELNVKNLEFSTLEKEFVWYLVKPNFRVLGKKVGQDLPKVQKKLSEISENLIKELSQKAIYIEVEGKTYHIEPQDVVITKETHPGIVADTHEGITIVLDTELTPDLIQEGLAREIVNKINTMRRDMGLEITDRINVSIDTDEPVRAAYNVFKDYIDHETLTKHVHYEKNEGTVWDLNGHQATIMITVLAT
jgi:isoleucyl-tRNA synthetase